MMMKKIVLLLTVCLCSIISLSYAQSEKSSIDRITFKVYATGIKSMKEAEEVELKFKKLKGVVETSFKFKSAENITTLFLITVENQIIVDISKEENAKNAQTFTGISEATFKDKLLQWGYDIYEVKRVTNVAK